jgi:hypothetical protein
VTEQRPAQDGVERRVAPRAVYLSPARLLRGDDTLDGRIQNLSESGLLIALPGGAPAAGAQVVIRFALPISGNVVSLACIAVRLAPGRTGGVDLGVRFVDPPEEAQKEIARFVAALAPPEPPEG